jgi:transposase InsO family protein
MEPEETIEKSSGSKRFPKRSNRYSPEFKLQVVKKLIEESVPVSVIQQECGVSGESIGRWVRNYRRSGLAGLAPGYKGKGRKLPGPVRQKIIDLKKAEPLFGIKRISQVLKRAFFLSASPETVRKTLRDSNLASSPHKKRQRNITRPRFFERSTPNQLWQTDIFTFRLGGHYAYLIGYIDDYSRYVIGLELFRSQTGQNVIEVYRRAASEYNPPKEMLTDNGRQYTSWRGNSRFEGEMKKDKIHHIKSRPHHPMTLGKIERFWKTIYLEFLSRAQFESFEEAAERIRQWVKYYNHKRPHQGIGGLCPADRYFEIQSELKKTIEQGIQENLLEMALRGKPKLPFYMVGRMEGQSVVLRAEKGRLRLSVDDDDDVTQEVVYNLDDKGDTHGQGEERAEASRAELRSNGEVPGSALGLDGAEKALGGLPGAAGPVDGLGPVAEAGHGGNAPGPRTESEPGQGPGPLPSAPVDAGEEAAVAGDQQQAGKDPVQGPGNKESGPVAVQGPEAVRRTPQDGESVA